MSHFCLYVRRQDYVRAAYWLAKIENELPEQAKQVLNKEIIGATYRAPDYKAILQVVDGLA